MWVWCGSREACGRIFWLRYFWCFQDSHAELLFFFKWHHSMQNNFLASPGHLPMVLLMRRHSTHGQMKKMFLHEFCCCLWIYERCWKMRSTCSTHALRTQISATLQVLMPAYGQDAKTSTKCCQLLAAMASSRLGQIAGGRILGMIHSERLCSVKNLNPLWVFELSVWL